MRKIASNQLQNQKDHKFPHDPSKSFSKSWFYKCIASP